MMGRQGRDIEADVVVLGGGLAGLSLSIALAAHGIRVVCVDRDAASPGETDIRTTALAPASRGLLAAIGVWPYLDGQAQAISQIRVADNGSPLFLHFDQRELPDRPEALGWIVDNRELRQALLRRVAELPGLRHVVPAVASHFSRDSGAVQVVLASGAVVRAPLLIGADGRSSAVRAWAGIPVRTWRYGQSAVVCSLAIGRPHDGIALEHFLPGGPFAVLPMTGERVSIVWSEADAAARRLVALPERAFLDEIGQRTGEWLGAVSLIGGRALWPLSALLAKDFVADRVALISEAAHAIHPVAGQGLNLGLRDVAALSQTLVEAHRCGADLGDPETLARYQRWRRFETVAMAAACDGLVRLFSNDNLFLRVGRRLGLAAVDRTGILKPMLMRQAMGLLGDVPMLAQGKPL